jgi:lipoprotein-releasing system permease protein
MAITLGIAVMILSVAVVNGFQKEIRNKVSGFTGHYQITTYSSQETLESAPIEINQDFYPDIEKLPEVKHIQVYAYKPAIIKVNDEIYGIVTKGISRDFDWDFIEKNLVSGTVFMADSSNPTNNIVLSKFIADKLKLHTGDKLYIYFVQQDGSLRPKDFVISGIYNTGLEHYDKTIALIDITHIQKRNKWANTQVGGFEIFLTNFNLLDEVYEKIYEEIPYDLNMTSLRDKNPEIFNWLELQDINVVIIIILMIVVAAINIISALFILILEKVNFIGVMKALGADNMTIRKVFLYQASYLILKGMFLGNIIGLGMALLQKHFSLIKLPQESYYVDTVPIDISVGQILLINVLTFSLCYIVLLVPSWVITKISPVKSIRFN